MKTTLLFLFVLICAFGFSNNTLNGFIFSNLIFGLYILKTELKKNNINKIIIIE